MAIQGKRAFVIILATTIFVAMGMVTRAARNPNTSATQEKPQKQSKDKKPSKSKTDTPESQPAMPGADNDVIDYRISEMLAGWQIGDVNVMHGVYADDVSVVSGAYEPPIVGWQNFVATYQKLRARITSAQKERKNTYTVVRGNFAWSTYQWEFHGEVDGAPAHWRGQTTLVLEKRAGKWMIVHDHTSVVADGTAPAPVAKP